MSRKLSAANPYMRDPDERERAVFKSVATSSAIEGIRAPFRKLSSPTVKFSSTKETASLSKPGVKRG